MRTIMLIGVAVLVAVIIDQAWRYSQYAKDVDRAVLNALWPLPRVIPGPWVRASDQRELDAATERIAQLRAWIETADLTWTERRAYRGWLNFCENDNRSSQNEIRTGKRRRSLDAFSERLKRETQRADAVRVPAPPSR
jgi:hypothetical protein